jgi:hypothetical protein
MNDNPLNPGGATLGIWRDWLTPEIISKRRQAGHRDDPGPLDRCQSCHWVAR